MRWPASVLVFGICGCSGVLASIPGTRESLLKDGAYDEQCPEGVRVSVQVPDDWKVRGLAGGTYERGSGEIAYETGAGQVVTWCSYSEQVWKRQLEQIGNGQAVESTVGNPERARLVSGARDRVLREREQLQLQAQMEADRRAREVASETAEAARLAAFEAEQQREHEAEALADESAKRDRRINALALLVFARARGRELISAHVCALKSKLEDARSALDRELRVARISGSTDPSVRYELGDEIVSLEDELRRATATAKGAKLKPLPCSGHVAEAARCLDATCDWQPIVAAFQLITDSESSATELESELRGKLDADAIASAEALAAQWSSAITP